MKTIYFITIFALALAFALSRDLFAQTNVSGTNASAEILALMTTNSPPKPQSAPTLVDSDTAEFDLANHKAVYSGHVMVSDPQMILTCVQLTVDLPQTGGRINRIVAETNVVIDAKDESGMTNHITCDKAVYDYNVQGSVTNDTITLTGNPWIIRGQSTNSADAIIWDRVKDKIHFDNPHMSAPAESGGLISGTNSPAIKSDLPLPK